MRLHEGLAGNLYIGPNQNGTARQDAPLIGFHVRVDFCWTGML
jgi:hypothetical protein